MLSRKRGGHFEEQLRSYRRKHLFGGDIAHDERSERRRVFGLLAEVLGYDLVNDVGTGTQICGPADLAVRLNGEVRLFISYRRPTAHAKAEVERAVLQHAVRAGVNWLLIARAGIIELQRVLTAPTPEVRPVFSIDLADEHHSASSSGVLQFLLREVVARDGLEVLWQRTVALDPSNLSALLVTGPVLNYLQRALRSSTGAAFTTTEVQQAVQGLLAGMNTRMIGEQA
jgi:hypothetical protein